MVSLFPQGQWSNPDSRDTRTRLETIWKEKFTSSSSLLGAFFLKFLSTIKLLIQYRDKLFHRKHSSWLLLKIDKLYGVAGKSHCFSFLFQRDEEEENDLITQESERRGSLLLSIDCWSCLCTFPHRWWDEYPEQIPSHPPWKDESVKYLGPNS